MCHLFLEKRVPRFIPAVSLVLLQWLKTKQNGKVGLLRVNKSTWPADFVKFPK